MTSKLDAYVVQDRIGEGGMGVVHLAVSPAREVVAVKVLRPHVVGGAEARARFAREIAALQRVQGTRVAGVRDYDMDGDRPFIAMRYVPGPSLSDAVRDHGPLTGPALMRLALGLAEALDAVHAAGLVHRDVKPGNVLLAEDGPVLIDFGLAMLTDDSRLTSTGLVVGTPNYVAPETIRGGLPTTATDVHGWAATVLFAATGHPPFGSGPTAVVLDRIDRDTPNLDGVDSLLRPILAAAFAKDPDSRPTVAAVLGALRRFAPEAGRGPDRGPAAVPVAVAAAAAGAGAAGFIAAERAVPPSAQVPAVDPAPPTPEPAPAPVTTSPVPPAPVDPYATQSIDGVPPLLGAVDRTRVDTPAVPPPVGPGAPLASATAASEAMHASEDRLRAAGDAFTRAARRIAVEPSTPRRRRIPPNTAFLPTMPLFPMGSIARLQVVALWVAAAMLLVVWPGQGMIGLAVAALVARAIDRGDRARRLRAKSRGARTSDAVWMWAGLPLRMLGGLLPVGWLVLLAGLAGFGMHGLIGVFTTSPFWPVFAGAVAATWVMWVGPGTDSIRRGAYLVQYPIVRHSATGWTGFGVLVAVAWALALVRDSYGTATWPFN